MLQHFFSLAMLWRLLPDSAQQILRQTPERNLFGFSRTRTHIDLAVFQPQKQLRVPNLTNKTMRRRSGFEIMLPIAIPRSVDFFSTCWFGRPQHRGLCFIVNVGAPQQVLAATSWPQTKIDNFKVGFA